MPSPSEWVLNTPPSRADARVAYGPGPLQFGDLFMSRGKLPAPLVVAIHGGFWKAEYDLSHLGHACHALAEAGFAVYSLEYRRVGNGGGVPATLEDVRAAVSSVGNLVAQTPIDLDRVVVMGHSAGGQLATWVGKELSHERGGPVRAVLSLAGVLDLLHGAELGLGGGAVDPFLGGPAPERPGLLKLASPIERLPAEVRQVLVHGENDDEVPIAISAEYARRATEAGDDVYLERLAGTGHYELIDPKSSAWTTIVGALRALTYA
jgi:acetyl esterase/lipase